MTQNKGGGAYNPHCDPGELGKTFRDYLPMCRSIAVEVSWRGFDYESIYEAAVRGLEMAARRWHPNLSSCKQPKDDTGRRSVCIIAVGEERCAHDGVRVTLGAYAYKFVWGEVVVEMRRLGKQSLAKRSDAPTTQAVVRELYPANYFHEYYNCGDGREDEVLQDGSAVDGSEDDSRWCSIDRARLGDLIEEAILGGDLVVSGLSPDKLRLVIASLSSGCSNAETAASVDCSDKAVARTLVALRQLLEPTDFARHEREARSPRGYSLRQVVDAICARYYPEGPSKGARQTIAKRVGEWAIGRRVSATRGSDHRWIFSQPGFTRCLELWQDLAAAETGGRRGETR